MSEPSGIRVTRATGAELPPLVPEVAALRIAVFRAFPYLYDGDLDYEAKYLETYLRSSEAVWVLAWDEAKVVGAATGLPLEDEAPELRAPFEARGLDPARVFYFGESVLLPPYRGQGLGHRFFDEREAHARRLGRFTHTAFAAVDRDPADPRRPPGHRDLDPFWRKRGYVRQPDMRFPLAWRDLGEDEETAKMLTFWLRPLEPDPAV
jgi:GNAT superfamily N-acetyltransferase